MNLLWVTGFIGGAEILIVFVVILLLFGADSIPGIAKTMGKGMREFRKASDEIKREFESHTSDVTDNIKDVTKTIEKEANDLDTEIKKKTSDLDTDKKDETEDDPY